MGTNMTYEEMWRIYATKRCGYCKFFMKCLTGHKLEFGRCKKYNMLVKMDTNANDCKGYKEL